MPFLVLCPTLQILHIGNARLVKISPPGNTSMMLIQPTTRSHVLGLVLFPYFLVYYVILLTPTPFKMNTADRPASSMHMEPGDKSEHDLLEGEGAEISGKCNGDAGGCLTFMEGLMVKDIYRLYELADAGSELGMAAGGAASGGRFDASLVQLVVGLDSLDCLVDDILDASAHRYLSLVHHTTSRDTRTAHDDRTHPLSAE